jgi:hypothetical protein
MFVEIYKRSFINLVRNPLELKVKTISMIFISLIILAVFSGINNDCTAL